ncbi:MAG: hypothetical protein QW101_01205 [Ignisphaera sp.]|uniref:FHA domain-containing protein n=1 Tax=Ignisphaera aggregans TaxID=334771 RepID=A0A7J3MWF6_9CREN
MDLIDENEYISRKHLISNESKGFVLVFDNGITVSINGFSKNGNRITEDILDEIAAAIVAIKMYMSSKSNGKDRNGYSTRNGNGKQGNNHLWYRSWLNEITKGYDINPYRRSVFFDQTLS